MNGRNIAAVLLAVILVLSSEWCGGALLRTVSSWGAGWGFSSPLFPRAADGCAQAQPPGRLYFPMVLGRYPPPAIPNDSYYSSQWGLSKIYAPLAWNYSKGAGLIIGIVDSGVDLNHPDLYGKLLPGYNYVNNSDIPQDDHGHGTHVAGIAAALTNNAVGTAGIGWEAKIIPVKVMTSSGTGYVSWIASGIAGAAAQGAKIINISLGGENYSDTLLRAVNYAASLGALVVAAAGNCGDPATYRLNGCSSFNPVIYPAAFPNVLAVGATDAGDQRAAFSSYGYFVDVAAPGVNVLSTLWDDTYYRASGTSMAAPLVSGMASLVWARNPGLVHSQVADVIMGSADDLGPAGWDGFFGYGRINAVRAVTGAVGASGFQGRQKNLPDRLAGSGVGSYEPGAVLVGFKPSVSTAEKKGVLNLLKTETGEPLNLPEILKIGVEPGNEMATIKALQGHPAVAFVEPNYLYSLWGNNPYLH